MKHLTPQEVGNLVKTLSRLGCLDCSSVITLKLLDDGLCDIRLDHDKTCPAWLARSPTGKDILSERVGHAGAHAQIVIVDQRT